MQDLNSPIVVGTEGLRGRLVSPSSDHDNREYAVVELDDGKQLRVPAGVLARQEDGSYYLPFSLNEIRRAEYSDSEHTRREYHGEPEPARMDSSGDVQSTTPAQGQEPTVVIPVVKEELAVSKRMVETGRAQITKHVRQHEEVVDEPLMREEVVIDRVPINRAWEGPSPAPRYEGDTLVIPLVEEMLVVEKRLVLKEELHIRRVQRTVHEPQTVVLRSEEVTVNPIETVSEAQ